MKRFFRPSSLAWMALLVGSAWGIALLDGQRITRLQRTSEQGSVMARDTHSPTGYAHDTRGLLLPADSAASQASIMDVQKMRATDTWSVTRADYDNAPEGRPVHGPFLYRWWLRFVALLEAGPGGAAVEQAALHADPALHVLLCLGAGLLIAWRFGAAAGGMLALGIAALFSQAQVFAPGLPNDHGLFLVVNLMALLLLLAAWVGRGSRATFWLAAAGALQGLGFWLDAGSQLVALGAVVAGGLVATWLAARPTGAAPAPLPWRHWAVSGALGAIAGWFLAGRPGGIAGSSLDVNHPLLALAWLGAAEILIRFPAVIRGKFSRAEGIALGAGALALLAPLAWLLQRGGLGPEFGPSHPALAGGRGLLGWMQADGLSLGVVGALSPLLLVPLAGYLLRSKTELRPALGFALGAASVMLLMGVTQLRWWALVDVMLLGLLGPVIAAIPGGFPALAARTGVALLLLPALVASWPRPLADQTFAPAEARALVERDLAQWLAGRADPGTIAFAPPALSGSLAYYGGLRVVASPYPGNRDGLALATRIAGTPSTDEAQALIQRRGIQYIVLPSWDDALDRLARAGSETPERSLVALLRGWLPPRWLRPVAYQMPVIPGLEQDSLAIFEVVEPQENALALSRLAEYFVETGRLNLAAAVSDSLEKSFAADAGAMIARAQVALAREDGRSLARVMPELLPAVADGRDEDLPWERRANLALVLAQTKHAELARPQVKFTLQEADAERLRSLGPVSLFRLLAVAHAYRMEFADPKLRDYALTLLPAEFRAQLGG